MKLTRIQLKEIIKKTILEIDDDSKLNLYRPSYDNSIVISGFTPKLTLERVAKYLNKVQILAVPISIDQLKVVKYPPNKTFQSIRNNIPMLLKNGFGSLADSIKVEVSKKEK